MIYAVIAVVGDGKTVFIYDVEKEDGNPVVCIKLETRVNDMSFIEDEVCLENVSTCLCDSSFMGS